MEHTWLSMSSIVSCNTFLFQLPNGPVSEAFAWTDHHKFHGALLHLLSAVVQEAVLAQHVGLASHFFPNNFHVVTKVVLKQPKEPFHLHALATLVLYKELHLLRLVLPRFLSHSQSGTFHDCLFFRQRNR